MTGCAHQYHLFEYLHNDTYNASQYGWDLAYSSYIQSKPGALNRLELKYKI